MFKFALQAPFMLENLFRKYSKLILLVAVLTTGFAAYEARNASVDYDYEKYFPAEDKHINDYKDFTKNFGDEGNFILIGLKDSRGVFASEFLTEVNAYSNEIEQLEKIEKVVSICNSCNHISLGGIAGYTAKPCLKYLDRSEDSLAVVNQPGMLGNLISKDRSSILLYVRTANKLTKPEGDHLYASIKKLSKDNGFEEYHISGKVVVGSHYVEEIGSELVLFFTSSIILVCLLLWFSFRSLWGVLLPLVLILATMIWTVAIMQWTGKSFDILMIMMPTIVFVVGMSDIVHFLNRYLDELRNGSSKTDAITLSFKEVGLATLLTSVTTAIGFLSLCIADVVPVREFGIYAGVSVINAFLLCFITLPALLFVLPVPKALLEKDNKKQWTSQLEKGYAFIQKRSKAIYLITAAIIGFGLFASSQLKVNNFLLEDLSEKDPVKQDYRFFEKHFSGVRPFEMLLRTEGNIFDHDVALQIEKLQNYLQKNYSDSGVGSIISPIEPIKYAYSVKHNNKEKYFRVPSKEKPHKNICKLIQEKLPEEFPNLVNEDSTVGRLSGRIPDVGSIALEIENNKLDRFIADSLDAEILVVSQTGAPILIDKNNESLSVNMLLGLVVAFLVIGIIVAVVYRSFMMVGIVLISNLLPLFLITIIMYTIGFDIKISTALIFTLAFGIAVDDTIHMLSKLKLLMRRGMPVEEALKKSYLTTGKAIIVTSFILCGGFLTLSISTFQSIQNMGILISITLFFAVVVDLTILPLLIKLFQKSIK